MSTFSTEEKTNLLFKKLMGKPSTLNTNEFFEELPRPARPSVIASQQLWTDDIPSSAPSDLVNATQDDNGNSIIGSYDGKTSTTHPHIKKYVKVPLVMVPGSNSKAYEARDTTVSHPYGYADGDFSTQTGDSSDTGSSGTYSKITQDTIPFNYDDAGSYYYNLYRNNHVSISFGYAGGDWVLDTDSGIITFYEWKASLNVNESNPPYISFYKYIGNKGISGVSGEHDGIFADGVDDNGLHSDTLKAIQVDDSNIASLSYNNLSHCIQFGNTEDGAWRLAAVGGGGDPTKTRFVIQVRVNGTWKSKTYLTAN